MKNAIRKIVQRVDEGFTKKLVLWLWPQYRTTNDGYMYFYQVLKRYFITQKILRINGSVPWPVHFTSRVIHWDRIQKGTCTEPGDNQGQFINATGGLVLGDNVLIGPNTIIATTNHSKYNHLKMGKTRGVSIGNNVWIGANVSIVAGTHIGDNVTIGAGCYLKGEIPSNSTVMQRAENLLIIPKTKEFET